MILPVFGPASLAEYIKSGAPPAPRPSQCPKCKARKSFWRHDHFERGAFEGELSARVRIERFLCHVCGLVISCLFAFLVPYRQATAALVGRAVSDYASSATTYRQEAEELSNIDSAATPKPSHGQVFKWVASIAASAAQLLLHVQKELLLRGHADAVQETIKHACPNAFKALSVEKANSLTQLAELVQLADLLVGETTLSGLQSYFLSKVESLQALFSGRTIRLANPHSMKHVIF